MFSFYIYTRDVPDLNTRLTNHFAACPTCGKPRKQGGIERVGIPNTIITTPAVGVPGEPGYVPPVMDPGFIFMIKFTGEAESEETNGEAQDDRPIWDRTRFGKAIKAASTAVNLTGNTSSGAFTVPARKITGAAHWLLRSNFAEPIFGGWQ